MNQRSAQSIVNQAQCFFLLLSTLSFNYALILLFSGLPTWARDLQLSLSYILLLQFSSYDNITDGCDLYLRPGQRSWHTDMLSGCWAVLLLSIVYILYIWNVIRFRSLITLYNGNSVSLFISTIAYCFLSLIVCRRRASSRPVLLFSDSVHSNPHGVALVRSLYFF